MLKKIQCLITAGPTREFFDPVRFISNPSSGKMGIELAKEARNKGWEVVLVLGPSSEKEPEGVKVINVISADDMLLACKEHFDKCDILFKCAAVSDVKPSKKSDKKLTKGEIDFNPKLVKTPDILKTLSLEKKENQILVGFAAQTHDIASYAVKKMKEKNLDFIIANNVADKTIGFASDENAVSIFSKDLNKQKNIEKKQKNQIAKDIIEYICQEKSFFK